MTTGSRIRHIDTLRFRLSMLVAGIVFAVVMTTAAFTTARSYRQELVNHQDLVAAAGSAYAATLADPVTQADRYAALASLRGIRDLPLVQQADVTFADGRVFVQLGTGASLVDNKDGINLWKAHFERVEVPILKGGQQIATLGMLSDITQLRHDVYTDFVLTALAALIAIVFGTLAAQWLITRMMRPLHDLTVAMARFEDADSFSAPVQRQRRDETGVLSSAFADMIDRIRERDRRIAEHMDTLELTVEARTRDLRQARDEAEAANAAKSEFLATMSHEIRTPMNGLLVMSEMLSAADLSDRHRRYADIISRSGRGLLTIINDILDLSKIEAGQLQLEAIDMCPETLATDVASLFWERARERGLQIATYVSPRVPRAILGDPTRINQIITNLVNNALKFTETGGVLISLDAMPAATAGEVTLTVRVRDTGIGIPADKIEHIFESFTQADQTTTRKFGGTGLGLAVCRKLVMAMGGDIRVVSEEGKGSEFIVTLQTPVHTPASKPAPSTLSIHLALDEGVEKTALAQALADRGCAVGTGPSDLTIARSGTIADGHLDKVATCIVLTDIGDTRGDRLLKTGRAVDRLAAPLARRDLDALLTRAAAGAFRGAEAIATQRKRRIQSFAGLRVLAADDNAVNREVLREALAQLDVDTVFVEDGASAVEAACNDQFDLILMDGSMPGMDGLEATRRIREYEAAHGLAHHTIVALTAQVSDTDLADWQAAGADDHITKPFSLDRLTQVLGNLGNTAPEAPSKPVTETAIPLINPETVATLDQLSQTSGRPVRARIWSMFVDKAPAMFQVMAGLVQPDQYTALSRQAHALKSMALSAGAGRLAATLQDIERGCQENLTLDQLQRLVEASGEVLQLTLAAMDSADTGDTAAA